MRKERAHTFDDFIETGTTILFIVVDATQSFEIFHEIHRRLKCSHDFLFSATGKLKACQ